MSDSAGHPADAAARKINAIRLKEITMEATLHVMPYGSGWDVIHEGARYAESHHATLAEAIAAGKRRARLTKVELLVHGSDGKVRASSYATVV
ncbi:DUF2188 domain-containing protein [Cupriavidus pampae]|nr:DUF2188 domain-containing protein [Cupriavidus pampae]